MVAFSTDGSEWQRLDLRLFQNSPVALYFRPEVLAEDLARLLTLAQSDDPRIEFEPVGAHPVIWNPREWLDKNRGL